MSGAAEAPGGGAAATARALVTLLLALVCVGGLSIIAQGAHGADLFPVYAAGWLFDAGRAAEIYIYDPAEGPEVIHRAWVDFAAASGFDAWLYAFVFPPLWAAVAAPVAAATEWAEFKSLFGVIHAAALAASFAVAADMWAGPGARHRVMRLSFLAALLAWPVVTSVVFNQVQAVVTLFVLLALREGEKGRAGSAGLMLALAASIKLTPALFGLYWLVTGRWRAAAWAAGWGAAVFALNLAVGGVAETEAFLDQLSRIAGGTPTSHMNQSLLIPVGAVLGGLEANSGAASVQPLARLIAAAISVALIAAAVIRLAPGDAWTRRTRLMPALMILCLTASPLAWIHYFTFLVPLALSLPGRVRRGWPVALASLGLMFSNTVMYHVDKAVPTGLTLTTQAAALLMVAALVWGEDATARKGAAA